MAQILPKNRKTSKTGAWKTNGNKNGSKIPPSALLSLHKTMLLIRQAEEKIADLLQAKEINCPTHLYTGQEAVAAGVCANLGKEDYVFGTHRSHGHFLAKGGNLNSMMAELYGKTGGCAKGRGGSMHLLDPGIGILGTTPIVASGIALAVGTALASYIREDGRVTAVFFGDGAVEEGRFHEALNLSALYKLPIVFVCENNLYSSHVHLDERQPLDAIFKHADAYGIPGERIDGNNVVDVFQTARKALSRARGGQGPSLLECRTYRWRGHVGPNYDLEKGIRSVKEWEAWKKKCPVKALESGLLSQKIITRAQLEALYSATARLIEESVAFARNSPLPEPEEVLDNVLK